MRVTKIHYFFTAPNNMYWNKIGAEAEIQEGDDVRQCLYDLKKQVESFFFEAKGAAEKQMEKVDIRKEVTGNIKNDIATCEDLVVLKTYEMFVKGKPDLQAVYDNQFKILSNGKS